jgi:asparagine N-glycosylation enzyme membrane subunit Stt3
MFPSSTDIKNARLAYLVFIFALVFVLSKTSLTAIFPILYKTVLFCAIVLIVVNIIVAAFNQMRKK